MNDVDEYFTVPISLIKSLMKSKNINSLIIESEPGLGKSYISVQTLKSLGLKENNDFVVISGFLTPLQMYKNLYDFQNGTVIIDDTNSVFQNKNAIGILLAATYNASGKRIVHYSSSTPRLDRRNTQFVFNGKMVFLANSIPKELAALKSRSYYYKLTFTWDEKIEILYKLAELQKIPNIIIDFIRDNANGNIDFRLPLKIHDLFQHNPENWEELALEIMQANTSLAKAFRIMKTNKSVSKQIHDFQRLGLGSERTFYYWKNKLNGTAKTQPK